MKENQILVIIKEPGKDPRTDPLFDNTLEAFQEAVGGYIETVTVATDICLVVNEEGRIQNLPYNLTLCGMPLFGTVIVASFSGDEFVSIKPDRVDFFTDFIKATADYEKGRRR